MVKKMSAIRAYIQACMLFGNDHPGQWPKTLEELIPKYINATWRREIDPKDLIYIEPPKGAPVPADIVVIYEKTDAPEVAVGFMDGHSELMKSDILRGKLKTGEKK